VNRPGDVLAAAARRADDEDAGSGFRRDADLLPHADDGVALADELALVEPLAEPAAQLLQRMVKSFGREVTGGTWLGFLRRQDDHEEQIFVRLAARQMHETRGTPLEGALARRQTADEAMFCLAGKSLRWRTERGGYRSKRIVAAGSVIASPAKKLLRFNTEPLTERRIHEHQLPGRIERGEGRRRLLQASQQRSTRRERTGHGSGGQT